MSCNKEDIINEIIKIEGGYVNDPDDSGGETKYGITIKVARANGYKGSMIDMPRGVAFNIYAEEFWDSVRADDLLNISELVAEEVVDTSVNMGPSRAGRFLQRSLNVLNRRGKLYDDILVDGSIGSATLAALEGYLKYRDTTTLVKALNGLQVTFCIELSERREKDENFIYGWLRNRVKI